MEKLTEIVGIASDFVWNNILLYVLVATGILFTIRLGFIQVRKFGAGWKQMFGGFSLFGKSADKDGMSSFQAVATSIAAQVGTGNIAGCATALLSGGPGAIFWMWLAAFFGMATIYGEAVLAQKYKTRDETGTVIGGPVYYIRAAFRGGFGKFLAGFFSVAIILALGFMGNMVQANSISDAFYTAFGVPKVAVGVVVAVLAGFIFLGGVKRIASVTEKVVPIMAIVYILGSLAILIMNIGHVPATFVMIFEGAFNPAAIVGGAVGITIKQAVRFGVARGLFSNEAGMGSTPHAHAIAKVAKPQDQGVVAMICVFIDTFIILTLTALVMISSGALNVNDLANNPEGVALAQAAFAVSFGDIGSKFVAVCLLFFAFSTIVGWYFFGEQNIRYLFGNKAVKIYAAIVVVCVVIGSVLKVGLVWNLADFFNGIMALPNLIALIALSGVVVKISKGEDSPLQK
ncbi:sodium:alanine symporter family protein [Pseudoflavonifractor sp. 524-17]|uniref:alanine/glycine:cation symporter family protein n=1 Tax=Pseudoflavonifractor sp. 524-17 TaxID=2304577 RepID=UPI00137B4171|nr:sodium:alanine symporter family protein [Pseudoflavonifractor sp. 524-17]NCE65255.1 sodium:alanine symporter family protein [Pseudoflavonifractor sp. 524-17]